VSTGFDLDHFLGLPRLSGLRLSPAGDRLVVSVSRPNNEQKKFASTLWELDPRGERPARRLTRSAPGESNAEFLPDGSLAFTSTRPDPDLKPDVANEREENGALWLLPHGGGEARVIAAPPGGVEGIRVARGANVLAFGVAFHAGATDLEEDAAKEKARKDAGVQARLFETYPIRFWDHYLGPRQRHLFTGTLGDDPEGRLADLTDLDPDGRDAYREVDFDILPDGSALVTGRHRQDEITKPAIDLVAIDRASRARRVLSAGDFWHEGARVSPDGRWVACIRTSNGSPDEAAQARAWLIDLETGDGRVLSEDLDAVWPHELAWAPDSSAVFISADRLGNIAVHRVELADGRVTLLSADGAYTDLCPTPDGQTLYALWATVTSPARPVRLDARASGQQPEVLPFPGLSEAELAVPGVAERLTATASDGTPIGSWLVRPADASAEKPAPLVVFIHGGPVGTWNTWHWRWNPHLLVERGYAVLLPDPAISTGYGQAFVHRGWGRWGETPFTDLISAVDGALDERPDLDRSRTAAMGGSFGGYMANWVAGNTDRFKAIVTHASLWEMRGFHGTTDHGPSWELEFGDPYADASRYEAASPHQFVDRIRTPMLVIHGELDHRVPISEALRLWTDLSRHGVDARFLYFPDENHWILKPQNARIWYETVLAFLDQHVLGAEWKQPALL
jgi:dipeptidyl aminopeptidase/acylaminoacyl peptidase